MRRILYAVIVALLFTGCCTNPGRVATATDIWGDATLVAEQRAEIEQLRRDLNDMGGLVRDISEGIVRITDELTDGLERSRSIEDIFREIDLFVRKLIEANRELGDLQPPDRREDAGEGRGSGMGIQ